MDSLGIIIYKDGEDNKFGIPIYMDDENYLNTPGHDTSFEKEIVPSFKFRLEELKYDTGKLFYANMPSLAKQGAIVLLNKKAYSTDEDSILGYIPDTPTIEQCNTLSGLGLDGIKCELNVFDEDFNVIEEYDSIADYISNKQTKLR